jgi:putative MFS transporter
MRSHRLFVPHSPRDIGTQTLLRILVATSLLGALVTWHFRIDTTGESLERIWN